MAYSGDTATLRASIRKTEAGLSGVIYMDKFYEFTIPRVVINGFPSEVTAETVVARGKSSRASYISIESEVALKIYYVVENGRLSITRVVDGITGLNLNEHSYQAIGDFIYKKLVLVLQNFIDNGLSYPESVFRVIGKGI